MTSADAPSIAAGLYAGLLGAAAGAFVGIDGRLLRAGFVVAALGVAFAVRNRPWIWVALGRRRLLAVPMAVPLTLALALVVGTEYDIGPDVPFAVLFWAIGFLLAGFALGIAGQTAYADHAAGEPYASWTAHADAGSRRRRKAIAALGGLGSVVALVASLRYGVPAFVASGAGGFALTTWLTTGRSREYEACERGLRYDEAGTLDRQFVPWERFDGVRETGDAIVLKRRWWFDVRMAAAEVPPEAREALRAAVRGSAEYSQWRIRARKRE